MSVVHDAEDQSLKTAAKQRNVPQVKSKRLNLLEIYFLVFHASLFPSRFDIR